VNAKKIAAPKERGYSIKELFDIGKELK